MSNFSEDQLHKIAKALESIAASLEKMSSPSMTCKSMDPDQVKALKEGVQPGSLVYVDYT